MGEDRQPQTGADPGPSEIPHDPATGLVASDAIDFPAVQRSPRFQELRRRHRSFVFPMTAFFLVWYLAYAITAMYAPGFMSRKVMGNINIGMVWGLLQFVTTFGITAWYVLFANKVLDPEAVGLRRQMEEGDFAPATTGSPRASGHGAGSASALRPGGAR